MEPKIKVYRGQVMQKDEFKKLFERSKLMFKSDRIVIDSLFSTSLNAETPRHFIRQSIVSEYLQKVVFQIDIDVRHQTRPFANVSSLSAFPKEDEILFMVGASFDMEKGDIWYDENEKFWISKLFLRRDNLLKDDRDFEYTTMSKRRCLKNCVSALPYDLYNASVEDINILFDTLINDLFPSEKFILGAKFYCLGYHYASYAKKD
ncbi:unnamed protein product [Didymodactylos carnosus]|uniref:ADP ribosyltransferase domain-containing protein n=1 Tax=Didymodactylos carnosus TaxID=1234261 RepID=A0A815YD28_9BILA|nr:unnamed protein product [Didymodactylos carnosus]CAF4430756.1 unnamed protein product [Didymodactylos carnosus]